MGVFSMPNKITDFKFGLEKILYDCPPSSRTNDVLCHFEILYIVPLN